MGATAGLVIVVARCQQLLKCSWLCITLGDTKAKLCEAFDAADCDGDGSRAAAMEMACCLFKEHKMEVDKARSLVMAQQGLVKSRGNSK